MKKYKNENEYNKFKQQKPDNNRNDEIVEEKNSKTRKERRETKNDKKGREKKKKPCKLANSQCSFWRSSQLSQNLALITRRHFRADWSHTKQNTLKCKQIPRFPLLWQQKHLKNANSPPCLQRTALAPLEARVTKAVRIQRWPVGNYCEIHLPVEGNARIKQLNWDTGRKM